MALREQSYLILLALSEGPLHGYGVIKTVRELSEERVRLGAGTLYGALDRLAADGLVAVVGEEVVGGRHRRYYDLTGHGREVLTEETARLSRLAATARRRLDPGLGLET
ncbi:PadR family transcriptional regulator [Streptosporangium carneum]|uniref:PadR family transcriptional regulator n=1 Tax=Streptosporangium carneum TaxID=47481 RepID=A0A9W6I425_9ACTN|nr:helix-turn-helix transcriptional regulator [Streptosporangium carneum]GLK10859.1 PadR family transcriptional regulator [Streptosporangium carneum]